MRKGVITILFGFFFLDLIQAQLFEDSSVLTYADQMPYFAGCENLENGTDEKRTCSNEHLVAFISDYLVYPDSAKSAQLEGIVYISFIIDERGNVLTTRVLKDIGGGCGREAERVVENMPRWEPAIYNGGPVKVKLNLPIHFSLHDKEPDLAESYNISWGDMKGKEISTKQIKENLAESISVRNALGETQLINELIFSFEKKRRIIQARSKGSISSELMKVVKKAKRGGTFTVTAMLQDSGKFFYVSRSYRVVE